MKKMISVVLIGMLLLMLFTGCKDSETPPTSESETSESEVATEPESTETPESEAVTEPESTETPTEETSETETSEESAATDAVTSATSEVTE
ncbi:MAG TPA: hypothetical protein PKY19_00470 [Oscillospiraceae bacterium]|nr:hypothetical protein [Oscillospiraceae bacterium]